ncbi:MAG TPA: hypothetical protein VIO38_12895 [Rariglobus sp.]
MKSLIVLLALAFTASLSAQTLKLSADSKGVTVDGGVNGLVVLGAPTLTGADKKARKATFAPAADGASATATYADGTVVTIALSPADGVILYSFDQIPADAISMVITTAIPLSYIEGGSYVANGAEAKPFPVEPGKQLFGQGAFKQMDFYTGTGDGLAFTVPATYQQLQDPRAWGYQNLQWIYHYDFLRYPGKTSFTFKVALVKK